MEYTSIRELLSTTAHDYLKQRIKRPIYRKRALDWLSYASSDILFYSRPSEKDRNSKEVVLVKDLIQYSASDILKYRQMGKLTIDAMKEALALNDLKFGMHSHEVEALLADDVLYNGLELADKFTIGLKSLLRGNEDGGLYIPLGKGIIPGYECTLNIKKV